MTSILQREYEDLRGYRTRLRKTMQVIHTASMFEPHKNYGPDGYNNSLAHLSAVLRSTDRRWEELCRLLGRPLPGPPIRLNYAPTRARAQPPVRLRTATRSAPYLTRMMSPR